MRIRKVAVVDPTLSSVRVVDYLLGVGAEVVLCCSDTESALKTYASSLEVRGFTGGVCALHDVDWVVELLPGDVEERAKFYNSSEVFASSGKQLLSSGIPLSFWPALRARVPLGVLDRLIVARVPFFAQEKILECAFHSQNSEDVVAAFREFCEGKFATIIYADGEEEVFDKVVCFWITLCLVTAYECKVGAEVADFLVASERTGVSCGAFVTLDYLGIDRFICALESFTKLLRDDDPLLKVCSRIPNVVAAMISDGFTGITGTRGGFYRVYDVCRGKVQQVIDLSSGLYREVLTPDSLASGNPAQKSNQEEFFCRVWREFYSYLAYLMEHQGVDVGVVERALCLGCRWKCGIEELAERVGVDFILYNKISDKL